MGSCGERFWWWPRRRGRRIPAAGCNGRANAGHGQKIRRPEGFRGKGPLASLLLSHRPLTGMLLRRASPLGLFRENRTPPSFQTGSKESWQHQHTNEWPTTPDLFPTSGAESINEVLRRRHSEIYFISRTNQPPLAYIPRASGRYHGKELLILVSNRLVVLRQ